MKSSASSRSQSLTSALRYARVHQDKFVSDLKALVRIPSVSFAGFDPKNVAASARAVAKLMKVSGLENIELLNLPGAHPYVYGDWLRAKGAPTLLLYAHHDVQPPGRGELWKSPPFVPTERSGRLYGRGCADDKAGAVMHMSAVASYLQTSGRLPLNIKVIIEGEEEIGSKHLELFLRRYARKMAADVMVLADTNNFDVGTPSLTTSLRGMAAMDVMVRTADHPLHSGMWGGPMPDPVQALSKMIASVTDSRGRLNIPGILKGLKPPSPAEGKSLRALGYTQERFRKESGIFGSTRLTGNGRGLLHQMWREPSFCVNAIEASSRKDCANIINDSAWCHMGLRLGPGMNPQRSLNLLKEHLRRHAPWGVKVEFSREGAGPAWTTDISHPAFQAARKALSRGFGRPAVFIGCGGSIPFVGPFAKVLGGAPALLIGVEDPYANAHSENESLHLGDFAKSIRSAVYLYSELALLVNVD